LGYASFFFPGTNSFFYFAENSTKWKMGYDSAGYKSRPGVMDRSFLKNDDNNFLGWMNLFKLFTGKVADMGYDKERELFLGRTVFFFFFGARTSQKGLQKHTNVFLFTLYISCMVRTL